jgi:hypothetical protein
MFTCIDPNYSDLIYCGSIINNELKTFRYTQNQRRSEIGIKKYRRIQNRDKKITIVENKNIIEHETKISNYNSKTSILSKFLEYTKIKNETNYKLSEFYSQEYHRKFKLNQYINKQKSESKMIKNFKNKYGSETIVIIGDYDKGQYNMKGKEPAICKRFRRIFKNNGYKVYLINEYKTSITCNGCKEDNLEPFIKRISKNPNSQSNKENKEVMVHGLLRCPNDNCKIIHNRDKNAVQNMINIVNTIVKTGSRPEIFCRKKTSY